MGRTQLTTREIGSVQRDDLDISTVGQAVVRRLVAGTNISFSQTGADTGTGDVTINAAAGGQGGFGTSYIATSNVTLSTGLAIHFPIQYQITSTFSLILEGTSIFQIL